MENEKFRNEIKSSDISEGEIINNQPIMSENQREVGGDFQENVNSFENIISSLNDNIDVTLDKMLKILEVTSYINNNSALNKYCTISRLLLPKISLVINIRRLVYY